MPNAVVRKLAHVVRRIRQEPDRALFASIAAALTFYVVVYPFTCVRYPPLVDLPFHAALTSIFRHYADPAWHFEEQFSLHPFEVPYLSTYGIGAIAALFVPIEAAAKVLAISMLLMLPAGLAVLFHGMRKSPLLGLLGLSFVWSTLTYWGFLNFVGALGLFAAAVGFALLTVDRGTSAAKWGLALTLVVIFFTHVYRLPFAFLGVLLAGLAVYPSTKRLEPLVAPVVPSLVLFLLWQFARKIPLAPPIGSFALHVERLADLPRHIFGAYWPPDYVPPTALALRERDIARSIFATFLGAGFLCAASFFLDARFRRIEGRDRAWMVGVSVLPVVLAAGLLLAYLVLPLDIGLWYYVFPRESVAAAYMLTGVVPDLPSGRFKRLGIVVLMALGAVRMSTFASEQFRRFDELTQDFRQIVELAPRSPKLFYLVFDRSGTQRRISPLLHLPAWIQAKKGGALNFHFVTWNQSPIRYREGDSHVPPPMPPRFEWEPQHFDVLELGAWFDTFLVRHRADPSPLFARDPTIRLVAHRGRWWLYRRHPQP